jgi:CheY-like chemotaxis protein
MDMEAQPRPSVLIADDDADNRVALREALGAVGIGVVAEAAGGREAVDLVARLSPDVVLMDLRMPGLDGFAATAAIREVDPWVQVVILTAYEELLTESAESVGAFAYLVKGCSTELMREVIVHAGHRSAELRRRGSNA